MENHTAPTHLLVIDVPGFPDNDLENNAGVPEIDSNIDRDSAIGGMSIQSSTESVNSSIFESVVENGRTYHKYKDGQYPLPNDEDEQDRLDYQHRMARLSMNGKLYLAPIPEPTNWVLDIATGTGIWAIEFADEHPKSTVIGTDLSPIQPSYVPANCSFIIDDTEDEWTFSQEFDYIHGRALISCFKDPKAVFKQAFDALAPGGYLELCDPIFPIKFLDPPPENSPLKEWMDLLMVAADKARRPWTNAAHYKEWLQEIGFVDIVEHREFVTVSPWAKGKRSKCISIWFQHNMLIGLEAWSMALFTRVLGWEPERLQTLLEGVREDIKNVHIHGYLENVTVYGRKAPLPVDGAAQGVVVPAPTRESVDQIRVD